MNKISIKSDKKEVVWFVYDGQCPICASTARAYKIKESLGQLNTLDARKEKDHEIMREINSLGLNIDEGMVIKFQNTHFAGADALNVMALLGTNSTLFNRVNSYIFKSKLLSKICYPFFKAARNFILFCKGVGKINNLKKD